MQARRLSHSNYPPTASACEPSKIGAVNREEGESAGFTLPPDFLASTRSFQRSASVLRVDGVQFAEKSALNAENIGVGVNGLFMMMTAGRPSLLTRPFLMVFSRTWRGLL